MKFCKDCKHYYDNYYCSRNGIEIKYNLETGKEYECLVNPKLPYRERSSDYEQYFDEIYCGPDAKYFEKASILNKIINKTIKNL